RDAFADQGVDCGHSETHIVPLVVGEADAAMEACEVALKEGIFAQAIRPPTVPKGTSRLRIAVMASHTRSELRSAAGVLAAAVRGAEVRPARPEPEPAPRPARVYDGIAEAA